MRLAIEVTGRTESYGGIFGELELVEIDGERRYPAGTVYLFGDHTAESAEEYVARELASRLRELIES